MSYRTILRCSLLVLLASGVLGVSAASANEELNSSEPMRLDTRGLDGVAPAATIAHFGGVIAESASWSSGTVHVVYGAITIPTNKVLTIDAGAIVKFVGGGIRADGPLVANGVVFTDLADDSVGGDTAEDGWTQPYASYVITGNVRTDGSTRFLCRDQAYACPLSGETNVFRFDTRGLDGALPPDVIAHWGGVLADSETWRADVTHVVYGSVVVPTNCTLTVESGARVKFAGGGILAKGPLVALGAIFTDLADDSVGGDTEGDGWTRPYPSYCLAGNVMTDAWTIVKCRDVHEGYLTDGTTEPFAFNTRGLAKASFDGMDVHWGGTLTEDTTWGLGVHVVYGTIFIPEGVTLTIPPGAEVRFVGGGLVIAGRCDAQSVTFMDFDSESPYPSYAIAGNLITDELTTFVCRRDREDWCSAPGVSSVFTVDTVEKPYRFAGEPYEVTFNAGWDGSSTVQVTETRPDGSVVVLTNGTAESKGVFLWDVGVEPGLYTLRHITDSNELSAMFYRLVNGVEHSGTVGNEVWGTNLVHVVYGTVTVPAGGTLTIEPGAVVKFMSGAKLVVAEGGTCTAYGVTFTHVNDDEHGGDTLGDGAVAVPDDEYAIVGIVAFDADTRQLYYPNQPMWVSVGNLSFRQRYPWNGLVDIDCDVRCSRSSADIALTLVFQSGGTAIPVRTVRREKGNEDALTVKSGVHRLIWDADADAPGRDIGAGSFRLVAMVEELDGGGVVAAEQTLDGLRLDTRTGTRYARDIEKIAYSPRWNGASNCVVKVNGVVLVAETNVEGVVDWPRQPVGQYTLTHEAGGEVLTATFDVPAIHRVVFDLGEDGVCTGGALEQSITNGFAATVPQVGVTDPWCQFVGWEGDFSNVTAPLTIRAKYEYYPESSIVWRNLYTGGIRKDWDLPLQSYAVIGETNTIRVIYKRGLYGDFGSPNELLCKCQNRLDGWFYVPDSKVGTWRIRQGYDDYMGLAVDGKWLIQSTTYSSATEVEWVATLGWHRFTIVCGDTNGDYGVLGTSGVDTALSISVNGGVYEKFEEAVALGSGKQWETPPVVIKTAVDGYGKIDDYSVVPLGSNVTVRATLSDIDHRLVAFHVNGERLNSEDTGTNGLYAVTFRATNDEVTVVAEFERRTFLVSPNGDDSCDARTWGTARKTINAAIRSAWNGDTILVTNGVYESVSAVDNRFIVIKSVNGFRDTVIDGGNTNSCAILGSGTMCTNTVLRGFTLRNGHATNGAGVQYGTIVDCSLVANVATSYGGGIYYGTAINSTFWDNKAKYGGGAAYSYLVNCSLSCNEASEQGGGTYEGTVRNSVMMGNYAYAATHPGPNLYLGSIRSCVFGGYYIYTSDLNQPDNVYTNLAAVRFVSRENGDLRVRQGSICLDRGSNEHVSESYDITGRRRIENDVVDVGAYEGGVGGCVIKTSILGNGGVSPRYTLVQAGDDAKFSLVMGNRPFLGFSTNGVDIVSTESSYVWPKVASDGTLYVHFATNIYVDASQPNDHDDGFAPSSAKRTLQAAIDMANEGEHILVAAGTYGPVTTSNKAVRIVGVKGHEQTFIDGGGARRCIWVGSGNEFTNTVFVGFTICNGYAQGGAGSVGGTFEYCIFRDCDASRPNDDGSAANWAGGAANWAVMRNCLMTGCHAPRGGATYGATLVNCTVVGNSASNHGGGTCEGTAVNCIIIGNDAPTGANYYNGTLTYTCTDPLPSGTGNINVNPYFTDAEGGDFRLRQYSPCLDVGSNAAVVGEFDLSGTNRIVNGRVDLGAYEGWVYLPVPPEVGGLEAEVDRRIGIVRLRWTEEEFARSYRIFRATANDVALAEEIGTATDCFFDDEAADPETDYWYWVAAANPTGVGPKGTPVKGRCLGAMAFGGGELASGTVGLAYRAALEVSGGSGKYTWTSGADDYDILRTESTFLMDIDEPKGEVFGDDVCKAYPLPFDFPFYGKTYNKLWISSNGTLAFDGEFKSYSPSAETLKGRVMIAPFWKDLLQGNGGVYVSENGEESVTFIWYECAYYSGNTRVNASATLFADGTVLCSYGEGNANGAFVGVSAGDGERYRYYDWLNQSLDNADDVIFAPQDVPGGLTLEPDGMISGKPNAPGTYVFTVFVTDDLGNGATRQVTLEIAENPNLRSVEFDLGEYGIRGGGGELVQHLMIGESAVPPSVRVRAGWVFDGWVGSYSNITDNTTVVAKYRTSHSDLHVDSIEVPENVAAGQQLQVVWTVGNTGNPAFSGTMNERIVLVSVADSNDVRVVATVKFEGTIARDGLVERSATAAVPLKGWDGSWRVRVETAIGPSVKEAGGDNARVADGVLVITPVPLPNLIVEAVSGDGPIVPGESFAVSYREKNEGGADAVAPWSDAVYLESVDTGASVRLGNIDQAEAVAAGGARSCAFAIAVPDLIGIAGRVRVRVEADYGEAVVESAEDDNAVYGEAILSLATNLYLSAASDSVKEDVSPGVRFTVKRSGPTAEPMTVGLSVDKANQVTLPETVTIPAGNASTIFYVTPIDNAVVDGARTVAITAQAGTCRSATLGLAVTDNEVPKLTISLDRNAIKEGEGKIQATVTRELVTDEPLTVYLSGVSTSRCTYPASVVIPAGEKSVTFEIEPVNNSTAEIAANLTLRASSSGYTSGSVSYQVEDDDVPGVTMSVMPEVVSEGAGSQAIYAKLVRSDTKQIDKAIRVRLTPSVTGQLRVPSEVTIPRYVMDYSFAIGVVDNHEDDGDREVEINGAVVIESCGCSGQPSNGDVIRAVVGIVDDDGPALSLSADPTTMMENLSPAGYLTLSRNSVSDRELTVRLWVDAENADEVEVPETVVIPAGERSIKVPVDTLNDGAEDGSQQVAVYAEDVEDVFAPASTWIQISDQNLPDLSVGTTTLPGQSLVALEKFTVSFEIVNSGFEARTGGVPYSVYIVKGSDNATPAEADLVKTGRATAGVPVGGAVIVTEELDVPEMPADYQVAIVLDPDGEITELNDMNNSGWSSAFAVQSAYHATAGVGAATYLPGEEVVITGKVTMTTGETPAAKVPIDVNVYVNGMRRTLKATTADDGTYSASFVSTSGEAGHYTVGACYPGMDSSVTSTSFDILGVKRTSADNVVWDIRVGDVATRTVYIQNLSAMALTDLQVSFKNLPAECVMTPQLPATLPGNGTVALSLQALADGVTDQVDYRKFTVQIASAEGVRLEFPAYFHSQSQRAYLRISPSSVNTTMAVGYTRYLDFTLVNDGKGDTGRVSISIPSTGWLRLASASVIDNLASGESAVITLEVSPSASDRLTLNNPLKGGRMAVNCANGDGCSVSLQFTPVSEATGSVSIDVSDNNTFMLESAPHLANASVRITNPYTGALVASGTTDETGRWSRTGLPEGRYQLSVTAPEHDSYADELIVNPGAESAVDAYLQNRVVQVDWKVEKTEIVDQYVVKQEIKYETQVPAPVVKTTLPDALQELKAGESSSFVIVLENTGVIAAERVTVAMPSIPGCVFELSDNDITLPAKSSKMIAAKISRPAPKLMKAKLQAASNEPVNECWYKVRTEVEYACGEKHPTYSYETQLKYGECVYASEAMAVALAQGWGWISSGGGSSSGGSGGGSTYVAPPTRGESSVYTTNTGDFSKEGGSTAVKKNCNPCLTVLAEALESVAPDVAKILLKSAKNKIRDEMLGKIPFMSCVDFLVNGSMAVFGKPVKDAVDWVENLPVFRQTIKGHFESYDEKRTILHAILDGSIDLASCGADVLAAIASAASDGTATVPAFATSAKAKDFLRKVRAIKDNVIDPISNLRQLEQVGEDVYFDVLKGKLDPDSDLGKRLRIACKLDPTTEARLTDAIKDVVVTDGAIDDMIKLIDEITGGLYDRDINWLDIDDFFKNVGNFRDDTDDTKLDPEKVEDYIPPSGDSPSDDSGRDPEDDDILTKEDIDVFINNWNNGVDGWMNGGDVPADAVDFEKILYHSVRLKAVQEYLVGRGVTTVAELLANAISEIEAIVAEAEDSVCASVSLKLSQTYAMTREAFDGTLTLYNGNGTTAITDLKMDVSVLDEDGNECRDLFVLNDLGTSGAMSSGWVLDGGLSISAGGTGSAAIQFVPSREAAPTEPKTYRFGGTITYVDPFTGENATMRLTPVALTVNPSPYLKLDYFIQRDVYADDPFTPDVVEASMPAEMSVLIRNEGGGDARNVTISSVQPEIVQNEKGLDVEFSLKDYVLEKTALNGATAYLGLNTASLGTVAAGGSQVAQWWLTSSIEGHFVGMSATVTPVNSWNRPDTSLVNPDVGTHKLIRSLAVEGEKLPYFLTSENSDLYGTPDTVYAPNGDCASVRNDGMVSWGGTLLGASPTLTIAVAARDVGWHYLNASVAGLFRYEVVSVTRSDGKTVPVRNAWITDRTFRDGKQPLLEERLHLADEILAAGTYTYTVVLKAKPSDVPEVVSFDGLNGGTVEYAIRDEVVVVFSKEIDLSTFTIEDLVLKKNGVHITDLEGMAIAEVDGSSQKCVIRGLAGICDEYGHYELIVQCAGISDLSGQLGTAGKSVGWTYATTEAPYVVDAEGVPTRAVRSFDSLVTVISTAIDPDSISQTKVMLNEVDVSGSLSFRAVDASGTRFEIAGLDSLQVDDGEYVLSIEGEGLRGLDGTAGVDTFTRSWTRDTVAPVLKSVEKEDSLGGVRVVLKFSEDVDPATLAMTAASLVRAPVLSASRPLLANAPQSLLDGAEIEELGNGTYAIGGFAAATSADGVYTFTFDASQVADEAGNVASGAKSVSWTVDTTPPARVADLGVSSEYGSVDTVVQTGEGTMTVSGVVPEAGATVQILCKYVGGGETLLAEPGVAEGGAFSAAVALPENGGNLSLIVRLTDAAGNSSDTEIKTYYDRIALTAELSGAPELGVPAETVTLSFSDAVIGEDVALTKFVLTRNGESVSLDGVTLVSDGDGKTFALQGLSSLCSVDGDYVLSFAAADVRKRSSGLKSSACAPLAWRYACPDREPPSVVSVRIDGEEVRGVYTNGIASVEISFSENVNLLDLSQKGLIGQALKVQLLDADSNVTGTVCAVRADVACEADGLTWTLPADAVPAGFARLVVDGGLVADSAGNRLAAGSFATVGGLQGFDFKSAIIAAVDSYAMPTWYDVDGDGLGDLVVGEKTAAGEGKVRVYRNEGTAAAPRFGGSAYLKVGGSDLSIAAGGCQGAQVAFGDLTGDGNDDLIVGYANGGVRMWRGTATRGVYGEGEALLSGAEPTYGSDRAFVCPYDLDGDGRLELVVGGMDGRFRVLRYAAGGGSTESWLMGADGVPLAVAAGRSTPVLADVNGDGCVDVLTGDTAGGVWAFLGDGRAWSAAAVPVFDNAAAKLSDRSRIGYGDADGDGVGDLLVGRADGSVELALGVKTAAPAFAFRVVRTLDVPVAVELEGETGKSALVVVDPEWARETFGAGTTDAEVADLLNGTGANGVRVWQSLALGLDPADPADRFLVDVPQNGEAGALAVEALGGTLREDLGVTVEYRFRRDGGAAQEGAELAIRLDGADDPTGVYSVTAVFVDGEGTEFAEIPAGNRIGVLRKAGAAKREIVPVPWKAFAQETMDIAVSNLVRTAELAAGDRLYVYDDAKDLYDTWELRADRTWKPVKTVKVVKGELEVQEADSPEVATVRRGTGVWLERNDVSRPVHLVGQYEAAAAEVRIEAGTAGAPKWNLVASPLLEAWDIDSIREGVAAADRIIVPTGGEPRIYTRDAANAKWGYVVYEADSRGVVRPVRKEGDTVLGPGTGFWYVSEGGAPAIRWNEAKEER